MTDFEQLAASELPNPSGYVSDVIAWPLEIHGVKVRFKKQLVGGKWIWKYVPTEPMGTKKSRRQ